MLGWSYTWSWSCSQFSHTLLCPPAGILIIATLTAGNSVTASWQSHPFRSNTTAKNGRLESRHNHPRKLPGFLIRWPLMVVHQLRSALQESLYLQAVLHNVEVGHNTDEEADLSRYIPGHNEQSIVQRQEVRGWTVSQNHKWCFVFLLLCILDTWITYPVDTEINDRNGQEENLEMSSNLQKKILIYYILLVIFFIIIYLCLFFITHYFFSII